MSERPTVLLDASAFLVYLQGGDGSEEVRDAILMGAGISAVNYAETLLEMVDVGAEGELGSVVQQLGPTGELALLLTVVPYTQEDAEQVAETQRRWSVTRQGLLSFGAHACLATAARLGLPVLTADPQWRAGALGDAVWQRRIRYVGEGGPREGEPPTTPWG